MISEYRLTRWRLDRHVRQLMRLIAYHERTDSVLTVSMHGQICNACEDYTIVRVTTDGGNDIAGWMWGAYRPSAIPIKRICAMRPGTCSMGPRGHHVLRMKLFYNDLHILADRCSLCTDQTHRCLKHVAI